MYLIDTVVFFELFKRRRHPGLVRWLTDRSEEVLFLSTVTIGEIERGIERQWRRDPAFAEALLTWLDRSIVGHDGADILIAATALEHRLTVVTRNIRHFEPTGVALENPFTTG